MGRNTERSCGVLINYHGLYLLGVITNSDGSIRSFGVPKGKQEAGEDDVTTALRELYEEANISLKREDIEDNLYIQYRAKSGKYIVIYEAKVDKVPENIKCNMLVPGSTKPEFDHFIWVTKDSARSLIKNHMSAIFQ